MWRLKKRNLMKKKEKKTNLISLQNKLKDPPNIENTEKMANTQKRKDSIPLRNSRKDFKNVNKSTEERRNGEKTTKRNTKQTLKNLNKNANTSPDQDSKTVQPTTEGIQRLPTSHFLLALNPNMSKSFPS